jgi:hypothetical protein
MWWVYIYLSFILVEVNKLIYPQLWSITLNNNKYLVRLFFAFRKNYRLTFKSDSIVENTYVSNI